MLKECLTPIVKHGGTLTLTQNVKVMEVFVLVKGDLYRVIGILNKKVIILFSNTMPNPGVLLDWSQCHPKTGNQSTSLNYARTL